MKGISSPNFNTDFFLDKRKWPEGPRLDFKKTWKNCLRVEDQIFKLVKHIIAFANVSYRIGKPCFIMYGVDDTTRELYDLRNDFPGNTPDADDIKDLSPEKFMGDYVQQEIFMAIQDWISPDLPDIQIEYGEITNDKGESILVAWFRIYAETGQPYRLKKTFITRNGKGIRYQKNTIFIRKGSNSRILDASQQDLLVNYHQAPHFEKQQWKLLIEECQIGDYYAAINYTPYLPHMLVNRDQEALPYLLNEIEKNDQQKIVIKGSPGAGKSLLIRRLAYSLAAKHDDGSIPRSEFGAEEREEIDTTTGKPVLDNDLDYIVRDIALELEPTPRDLIPIFYTLRTDFSEAREFEHQLSNTLSKSLGITDIIPLEQFFNIPGSKWIIMLDGLDELHNLEDRGPKLIAWIKNLPLNVKVVLTTRSHVWNNPDDFDVEIEIKDLNFIEIQELVRQKIYNATEHHREIGDLDYKEIDQFINYLRKIRDDIEPILCSHRAIDGFVKYIVDSYQDYRAAHDLPVVETTQKNFVLIEKGENYIDPDSIPFIPSESIQPSDDEISIFDSPVPVEENRQDERETIFSLGIALRFITNYIREENKKRMILRTGLSSLDDQSRRELEKSAWLSDWQTTNFKIDDFLDKDVFTKYGLEWNEQLGLIKPINHYYKQFLCSLYQWYSAAEYSCTITEIPPRLFEGNEAARKVQLLHIELMEANGLTPLIGKETI